MAFHYLIYFFLILPLYIGCGYKDTKPQKNLNISEVREPMMDENKSFVKKENEKINRYVERYNLDVTESGTGLRYIIYGEGTGEKARQGQLAFVNYKVSLLDGTVCYSSDSTGTEEFMVGMDDVESGLHEGITYMKVGQKAKFILPSHLAHGLIGDKNKIPARAAIIYDLELLALK
jgi:FKBP-type peptidyl-prolyl cis-trans isomerase FkpA